MMTLASCTWGNPAQAHDHTATGGDRHIPNCSFSNLLDSGRVGSVFVLQFELLDFAATTDLDALQKSLPPGRPHWEDGSGAQMPVGAWCQELPAAFQACTRSNDMLDWQRIVRELSKHEDFSLQPYYFHVLGPFERGADDPVGLEDGAYTLRSSRYYELRVFHWDPSADAHSGHQEIQLVEVRVKEPWFEVRTNSILTIDSPYDVDVVEMKTGSTSRTEHGLLELVEKEENPSLNRLPVELYIPVRLKGSIWRTALYGFLIGTLIWAQQYVALPLHDQATPVPLLVQIAVVAVAYITGFFIAYAIPRPT